ncbi:hypothetical protein BVRB_025580, partial [Beta vulgaris subsp. vulgaris]
VSKTESITCSEPGNTKSGLQPTLTYQVNIAVRSSLEWLGMEDDSVTASNGSWYDREAAEAATST